MHYKYQCAHYTCLAFCDFYEGIDAFKAIDAQKLNSNLLKRFVPFTPCTLSMEELVKTPIKTFKTPKACTPCGLKKAKLRRLLNWFVPAFKGRTVYSDDVFFEDIDFFSVREVCVVDPKTGKGLSFKKSYLKAFLVAIDFLRTSAKVCLRHKKAYKKWHEGNCGLRSLAFWKNYLGI